MSRSAAGRWRAHIVEEGDTLSGIALEYLGNAQGWAYLARLNRYSNPDLIQPGDIVMIRRIS